MRPDSVADILARIPDARERNLARVAETVKALKNAPLEWTQGGLFFALDAAPFDKQKGNRAATVFDLSVVSSDGLIFRDRVQCWDGARVMHEDRVDPEGAMKADLLHTVKVVTKGGPWVKDKPGTVSTFYAGTGDGFIESGNVNGEGYSAAREGTSSGSSVNTGGTSLIVGQDFSSFLDDFHICYEAFLLFDTSALSGEDVSDAVLSLRAVFNGSTQDFTAEVHSISDWGTLAYADWVAGSALGTALATWPSSSYSAAYQDFTGDLSAAVNKTGSTFLLVASSRTRTGDAPTSSETVHFSSADTTGTTQDPKLVVTHEAAAKPFRRSLLGVGF